MNLLLSNTIDWASFGIVLGILAALAIVFTILIVVVNKLCEVKEDPRIGEVAENLSGANCGGCGFAGCADFAKALVEGRADLSSCSATAKENKAKIASVLGVDVGDTEPKMAVVKCVGGIDIASKKFEYVGNPSCASKTACMGGDKDCSKGCLGGGDCQNACQSGGIKVIDGVAKIDKNLCTACNSCVRACPKQIISLVPKKAVVYVACSSECKGKEVMSSCKVGCIGCGLCAKNCPENAITMVNNLAIIDYSKCTGCKTCVAKCPRKIIKEL